MDRFAGARDDASCTESGRKAASRSVILRCALFARLEESSFRMRTEIYHTSSAGRCQRNPPKAIEAADYAFDAGRYLQ